MPLKMTVAAATLAADSRANSIFVQPGHPLSPRNTMRRHRAAAASDVTARRTPA